MYTVMICVYFFSHTTITHSFLLETKNIYKESLIKNVYSSTYDSSFFFSNPFSIQCKFLFIYLLLLLFTKREYKIKEIFSENYQLI